MVSVWDRSRAVGGCFTVLRRTDFVCLSIAYSVTVWFWKCWLCFLFALLFLPLCCDTRSNQNLSSFTPPENEVTLWNELYECFCKYKSQAVYTVTWRRGEVGWGGGERCSSLSTHVLTLFGFCSSSSTVVNIMLCDLSSGQMIRFVLPLSFTPNRIHLRARKWLCSCHNWSTARRDGSACFCYYLFYLSQNRILNLHCIPLSHRPLHDQYPHQRLCGDSRILWSMFVELDLLS